MYPNSSQKESAMPEVTLRPLSSLHSLYRQRFTSFSLETHEPQPANTSLYSCSFCFFVSSFHCHPYIFSQCLSQHHTPVFPQHLALFLGTYFCTFFTSFCCLLHLLPRCVVLTTSSTSGHATLLATSLLCRNTAFLLAPLLLLANSLWVIGGSRP